MKDLECLIYSFTSLLFTKSFLLLHISHILLLHNRSVFGYIYMALPFMPICPVLFALCNVVHKHNCSTQYTSIRVLHISHILLPHNRSVFGYIYVALPFMPICPVLFALCNVVHKHNCSTQYTSIRVRYIKMHFLLQKKK